MVTGRTPVTGVVRALGDVSGAAHANYQENDQQDLLKFTSVQRKSAFYERKKTAAAAKKRTRKVVKK